jgi:hypothetical protein
MSNISSTPRIEPPLPQAAPALPPEGELLPELTFWRRPWVVNILPWITSVTIHLGLIILVLATYKAAGQIFKVVQEQIIIPDASLAADPGSIPNPGLGDDSNRNAGQELDSTVTESNGFSQIKSNLTETLIKTPTGSAADEEGAIFDPHGNNKGLAGGASLTDQSSGALAQFGNPGGGQIGPHGKVFGHGGNAMRIVYICDASGSMMSKMDLLKLELDKSVEQLQPVQAFDVIFFQDSLGNPNSQIDLSPDLMMATAGNKKKLYTFLQDIVGQSSTHVIPALTTAFNLPTRPELIYLLTDGAFEDEGSAAVIDAINSLNAQKKVKVNTILFVFVAKDIDPDELKEASAAMKRIATDNGGVYNQVSVSDLGN